MQKSLPAFVLSTYLIVLSFISYSQTGGVSINNTNTPAHPSAMLDVSSTSSPYMGMLIPRMSTASRNTIATPATGLQIFNTDCGVNEYYTGTCWVSMSQNLKSPLPITCSGSTDFCANETRTLSIPPVTGATNYYWFVPAGATITSGQGTSSVTVAFGNNSGQVCVRAENACEMSQSTCLDLHINPVPLAPGNITGPQTIIPGATLASYFIAAVPTANLYNWTLPSGATITAGVGTTNINVSFSCSAVSGYVSVTAQNNCGVSYPSSLSITATPVIANAGANIIPPGTLGGSPTAIGGTTPYTYSWVPSTALNSSAVANPTSTACATTTYTVTVTDYKGCTSSSSTTALDNNHVIANAGTNNVTPGTLGGSPTATSGTPPYAYSWVPSTGLSSIGASNPTTTVCSTTAYTVTVTDVHGCTSSSSTTALDNNHVLANAGTNNVTPGTLGGSPTATSGTPPYAYSWVPSTSLSNPADSNPTTTVCSTTAYTVIVTDVYGCTSSSSTTALDNNHVIANAGPDIVSPGTLGGSPTASGGTLPYIYVWVPSTNLSSTMVANPTTTICAMTTYTVTVTDANGCSSSSSATATIDPVPATPGSITGNTSPSCPSTEVYSISPVTYATTYTWTVPAGNIIASGQGTNSITVNVSGASGDITVTAGNCGTSSASTLAVTVTGSSSGSQTFNATGSGRTGSIQTFTVPQCIASLTIEAWGAQGGSNSSYPGGKGTKMQGTFSVASGQVLKILVGQTGTGPSSGNCDAGGGGGTFVTDNSNNPLIIAGGGGGSSNSGSGKDASVLTSGVNGDNNGFGGTNGSGGSASSSGGSGGGGLTGDGMTSSSYACAEGGKSFVNGGAGGGSCNSPVGGYGGGAGGHGNCYIGGGGGGGYSGGGGGGYNSDLRGGGGGSYNGGTNQTNTGGVQSGNGQVIITY